MFCPLEVAHKSDELYMRWHLRAKQRRLLTFCLQTYGYFSSGDAAKFPNEILDELLTGTSKLTSPACQGSHFSFALCFFLPIDFQKEPNNASATPPTQCFQPTLTEWLWTSSTQNEEQNTHNHTYIHTHTHTQQPFKLGSWHRKHLPVLCVCVCVKLAVLFFSPLISAEMYELEMFLYRWTVHSASATI